MRSDLAAMLAVASFGLAGAAWAQEPPPPGYAPPPAGYGAPPPGYGAAAPPPSANPSPPPPAAPPPFMRHIAPGGAAADTGGPWAHQPGTGVSGPASGQASNTDAGNTRSDIAPHFETPNVGPNAGPEGYLMAASQALRDNRTGEAQQALEMAETRMLTRSIPVSAAGQPARDPRIQAVSQALQALGRHDLAGAQNAIAAAMQGGGTP